MILVEKDGIAYLIDEKKINEFENKGFKKIVEKVEEPQTEIIGGVILEVEEEVKSKAIKAKSKKLK